jgi:hypothetical protein
MFREPPQNANGPRLPCRAPSVSSTLKISLQAPWGFRPLLLEAHSQTMDFQIQQVTNPCAAPSHAESMVLPRLVIIFPHMLTSLHRVTGGPLAVCAEVPLCHTFRWAFAARFQGSNTEATLTVQPRLFAVRHRLHVQLPASGYPPFIVELFTAALIAVPETVCSGPVPCGTRSSLRRPRLRGPVSWNLVPWGD